MRELISREEAVRALGDAHFKNYGNAIMVIQALPSAEPKTGKWIPVRSYEAFGGDEMMWAVRGNPIAFYYCSNCRNDAYAGEDGESLLTKYCPECGADMGGKKQ